MAGSFVNMDTMPAGGYTHKGDTLPSAVAAAQRSPPQQQAQRAPSLYEARENTPIRPSASHATFDGNRDGNAEAEEAAMAADSVMMGTMGGMGDTMVNMGTMGTMAGTFKRAGLASGEMRRVYVLMGTMEMMAGIFEQAGLASGRYAGFWC